MDYSKNTIPELKVICKEKHIKGYSTKNKQGLIEMIQQNDDTPISAPQIDTETDVKIKEDTYTKDVLIEQYALHKSYVKGRKETTKKTGVKVRLPSIPEDISENIVKYILHNKLNDKIHQLRIILDKYWFEMADMSRTIYEMQPINIMSRPIVFDTNAPKPKIQYDGFDIFYGNVDP